jgi:predicted lipoprotein with Yx(FWY)xxD motif
MNGEIRIHRLTLALTIFFVALLSSISSGQQTTFPILSSTPAGIMLVEVHREEEYASDQFFWTRLGADDGSTLFYFTGNEDAPSAVNGGEVSTINFLPLLADEGASAFDDWSLILNQGSMQWTYQSNPLYTWSEEKEPGEIALNMALYGARAAGVEPMFENSRGALLPPIGWHVALFTPASSINIPDGLDLRLIDSGQGIVLTNFEGYSLYHFDDSNSLESSCTDKACFDQWSPIAAPALAIGFDNFSILDRIDGTRQWAFRGNALFRYSGDLLPGDAHGREAHPNSQLTLLQKNFRPEGVNVIPQPNYGDMFALNGRTLYFGSAFEKYWGGRNLRGSFDIAYFKGKRLGGNACVNGECLKFWLPFNAAADAKSSGFWEVITRVNGSKQWAYKGFALYTHNDDETLGHIRGHSLYDIADVDGNEEALTRTRFLAKVGNAMGGAGIYWSIAKP